MIPDNSAWSASFIRLISDRRAEAEIHRRHNPRPAGVIRRGSVTHQIVELLEECPRRAFQAGELQTILGSQRGAISFALHWLTRQGLVDVLDDQRNPRYRRYRFMKETCAEVSERPEGDCAHQTRPERLVRDAQTVPQSKEPGRTCGDCENITAGGSCKDSRASGIERPDQVALRRCVAFVPKYESMDSRNGRQLWPELIAVESSR
jgi:DNA-binding transcriptional ArsR family regulator